MHEGYGGLRSRARKGFVNCVRGLGRRDPWGVRGPRAGIGRWFEESQLAGRPAVPSHHVLRDSGLSHLEAELQKLTVDARGTPERVVDAHLRDQRPQLGIDLRPPSAIARPPAPVAAKPSAMPPNERLGRMIWRTHNRWKPAIQLDEDRRSLLVSRALPRHVRPRTISCWRRTAILGLQSRC